MLTVNMSERRMLIASWAPKWEERGNFNSSGRKVNLETKAIKKILFFTNNSKPLLTHCQTQQLNVLNAAVWQQLTVEILGKNTVDLCPTKDQQSLRRMSQNTQQKYYYAICLVRLLINHIQ